MIYDPMARTPAVSFHRLGQDAVWLEELLENRGIPISPGSELAESLKLAKSLVALTASPPDNFDPRTLAAPLGLLYLSRALADAQFNPSFNDVCRLLPNLAGEAAVPQASDTSQTGDRDLVFELEMAAVVASMGAIVKSALEPDVKFTLEGTSWDVACKLIYSKNPVTLNDRIEEGIAQIRRFPGDYGLVFVGVTNRVDHRRFLPVLGTDNPVWGVFRSGKDAEAATRKTLREIHAAVDAEKDVRFFRARDDTKFRGIITVLHAIVGLGPFATILTSMGYISRTELFGEFVSGPEDQLAKRLNERMQNIFAA